MAVLFYREADDDVFVGQEEYDGGSQSFWNFAHGIAIPSAQRNKTVEMT